MRGLVGDVRILVELGSDIVKPDIFASDADQPAEVAIKLREKGWSPYRVRFDDIQAAWIVSSLDYMRPLKALSAKGATR